MWCALLSALLLVVGLGLLSPRAASASPLGSESVAHFLTDPCGSEPDWWDAINWLSWNACEITNGASSASSGIVQVVSPVFNDLSSGIASVASNTSGLVSAVGSVAGSVVSGVSSFLTPSTSDLAPLTTQIATVQTHQPFAFVSAISGAVTNVESAWETAAGASALGDFTPASLSAALSSSIDVPCAPNCPSGVSSYDFGPLSAGVAMWLWFMARIGMSQGLVRLLMDGFCWLALLQSVMADLGVMSSLGSVLNSVRGKD